MEPNTQTPEKKTGEITIQPLRTYEQDIRDAVVNQNVSLVKMAVAQNQRQQAEQISEESASPTSKKNLVFIGVSAFLVVCGLTAIIGTAYYLITHKAVDATLPTQISTFISEDASSVVNMGNGTKRDLILKLLTEQRNTSKGLVSVVGISGKNGTSTENTLIPSQKLLSTIESRAPESFIRSLYGDFTFGFYGKDRIPFLILRSSSFDQSYAGMLEWEKYMRDDLRNIIFPVELEAKKAIAPAVTATSTDTSTSTNPTASSTDISSAELATLPNFFIDQTINNKDVRVLVNRLGDNLILYGFADKEFVVITRSVDAFKELVERIRLKKLVR